MVRACGSERAARYSFLVLVRTAALSGPPALWWWFARAAAVSGRPRCARYGLGCRSLSGGSHTHPGRSIVAAGTGRALRSFLSPPSGRFATFGGKCPQGTRFPPVPSLAVAVGRFCGERWGRGLPVPVAVVVVRTGGPFGSARAVPVMGWVAARFRAGPVPIPVAQSSRRALAAPSARFAPHLRGALPPSVASAHRAHASLRCLRSLWRWAVGGRGGVGLLAVSVGCGR